MNRNTDRYYIEKLSETQIDYLQKHGQKEIDEDRNIGFERDRCGQKYMI